MPIKAFSYLQRRSLHALRILRGSHLTLSRREPPSADRGVLPVSGGLPSTLQTLSYSN